MIFFELMTGELEDLNLIIRDIYVYKSYIVVLSKSQRDGKLVHVFDKETGARLLDAVEHGRGPKEYLSDRAPSFTRTTGAMKIYDSDAGKILSFQIDSLMARGLAAVSVQEYESPMVNVDRVKDLEEGTLFVSSPFAPNDVRFLMLDDEKDTVAVYNEYPEVDLDDDKKGFVFVDNCFDASPSEDRFVIGTFWGSIMEVFSLDKGVRKEAAAYLVKPDFTLSSGGFGSAWPNEKTVCGFGDIYVTDTRIYSAFDGTTKFLDVLLAKDQKPLICTSISVFDWDCRGLKRIQTDYRIERLCADEGSGTVYAVIYDTYMRPYLGKVKL